MRDDIPRRCTCGRCRDCWRLNHRCHVALGTYLRQAKEIVREAEIRRMGPQLVLACQVLEAYAKLFGLTDTKEAA